MTPGGHARPAREVDDRDEPAVLEVQPPAVLAASPRPRGRAGSRWAGGRRARSAPAAAAARDGAGRRGRRRAPAVRCGCPTPARPSTTSETRISAFSCVGFSSQLRAAARQASCGAREQRAWTPPPPSGRRGSRTPRGRRSTRSAIARSAGRGAGRRPRPYQTSALSTSEDGHRLAARDAAERDPRERHRAARRARPPSARAAGASARRRPPTGSPATSVAATRASCSAITVGHAARGGRDELLDASPRGRSPRAGGRSCGSRPPRGRRPRPRRSPRRWATTHRQVADPAVEHVEQHLAADAVGGDGVGRRAHRRRHRARRRRAPRGHDPRAQVAVGQDPEPRRRRGRPPPRSRRRSVICCAASRIGVSGGQSDERGAQQLGAPAARGVERRLGAAGRRPPRSSERAT